MPCVCALSLTWTRADGNIKSSNTLSKLLPDTFKTKPCRVAGWSMCLTAGVMEWTQSWRAVCLTECSYFKGPETHFLSQLLTMRIRMLQEHNIGYFTLQVFMLVFVFLCSLHWFKALTNLNWATYFNILITPFTSNIFIIFIFFMYSYQHISENMYADTNIYIHTFRLNRPILIGLYIKLDPSLRPWRSDSLIA